MKPYINEIILVLLVLFFGVLYLVMGRAGAQYFLVAVFSVLLAFLDPRRAAATDTSTATGNAASPLPGAPAPN